MPRNRLFAPLHLSPPGTEQHRCGHSTGHRVPGRRLALCQGLGWALAGVAWPAVEHAAPDTPDGARAAPAAAATHRPTPLPATTGPVLLSVTGQVSRRNTPTGADFDLAMLEALPQHSFQTHTPWDTGPRRFSGPLLREVLAQAGAQGRELRAEALNRYAVDIPVDDLARYPVLLATRLDGQLMRVRDRGPLFVIYPFDDAPELKGQRHYDRSIWQLRHLQVR